MISMSPHCRVLSLVLLLIFVYKRVLPGLGPALGGAMRSSGFGGGSAGFDRFEGGHFKEVGATVAGDGEKFEQLLGPVTLGNSRSCKIFCSSCNTHCTSNRLNTISNTSSNRCHNFYGNFHSLSTFNYRFYL